jgi:predicted regulator of Ras-like GTPase activity (Roadblock/LC7/MglB family)
VAGEYLKEAAMMFKETLRGIVRNVEGGIGAVIMGYDGIPIDEFVRDDAPFDLQLLAVEYATVLKEVKRTIDVLKTGEMEEMSITTQRTRVLVRALCDDFFAFLVLDRQGNYGKGRYLLKRNAPEMLAVLQ